MNLKYIFFVLIFCLYYQYHQCNSETITYISTERPAIYWYDTKYFKNFTLRSRRWNRQDPRHYVDLYIHLLFNAGNNVKLDFYFYQFLTNRYKPSFVEMHFKFCDMVNSDPMFGIPMKIAAGGGDCPYPPGVYDLHNMTIPLVPKGFPFPKGRINCNVTIIEDGVPKHIARGSIDMEVAYDLRNMSIPYVPKGFPFPKGRIYCNLTLTEDGVPKHILRGSIDMEVKVAKIRINKIT